jgi:hypothetical protein
MKLLFLLLALALTSLAEAATTCVPYVAGTPLAITLTFTAPTVDGYGNPLPTGTTLTYNVYMGTASGAETLLASGKTGSPIVINSSLAAGNSYYLQVAAVDANGIALPSVEVCKGPFPAAPPGQIITITIS